MKKYNKHMCFVLPLTTQIKDTYPWYQFPVSSNTKKRVINLSQGKTISTKRLLEKESVIGKKEFSRIVGAFKNQF